MTLIFEFTEYKSFVEERIKEFPAQGRGQLQKLAQASGMQASNLSQVFKGEKELTLEQADAIAKYLQLSEVECDFFLLLVSYARAGTASLKTRLKKQILAFRKDAKELSTRLPADHVMGVPEKAIFYSNWDYSAVHMLTFIPEFQNVARISEHLNLPRPRVQQIVDFLLAHRLCISTAAGIVPGSKHTHLEASSPLITRHHSNWRIKAIDRHSRMNDEDELAYSGQVSLSKEDAQLVRELCIGLLEEIRKRVDPSPSEVAYNVNLDWLKI